MRIKHRPVAEMSYELTPEGWAFVYRVRCACGAQFAGFATKKDAVADRDRHRAEVAPAADERCRDTRAHRTRWWDPCSLCQCQDALPGFEDLGATG